MTRFFTFLLFICSFSLTAQITITDDDLGAGTYNWTKDNVYILDGNVFLEAGGVLNIEAGTVIKGKAFSSDTNNGATLIITNGATINAEGTATEPIIFTSELDDLSITNDLTALVNQTWGGIVVLGDATVGEDGGFDFIEGIPSTDDRGQYGGNNDSHSSGILKYVSIRHGGSEFSADNEINGLTLGGVGNGTTIDYVEVFANKDDGIEFFGGTVNATHIVAAFVGDDSFDYDESWNGYCQWMFSLQQGDIDDLGDNAVEYDGSEKADGTPKVTGRLYNATLIGSGTGGNNSNSDGIRVKSDGAMQLWNSIITNVDGYAIRVEDTAIDRLAAGESAFANNIIYSYGTYVQDDVQAVLDALAAGSTMKDADPVLYSISYQADGGLDPRPYNNSPALSGAAAHPNEGVDTDYRGAFPNDPDGLWIMGWTALDEYGYLPANPVSASYIHNTNGLGLSTPVPNPAVNETTLNFNLIDNTDVNIYIIDMTGKIMTVHNLGQYTEGEYTTLLNTANLESGNYILALETAQGVVTQKLTKVN